MIKDLEDLGLESSSKVAILASADDKSHDLIETVLLNAGYTCRLFQAFQWFMALSKATTVPYMYTAKKEKAPHLKFICLPLKDEPNRMNAK